MKAPPLLNIEWSQQEVRQHRRFLCLRLDTAEHQVHGGQRCAEACNQFVAAQRLTLCLAGLNRQWRFAAFGKEAAFTDCQLHEALRECGARAQGSVLLQTVLDAFSCGTPRGGEMLYDLVSAPARWVIGRVARGLRGGSAGQWGSEQLSDLVQQRVHGCHCVGRNLSRSTPAGTPLLVRLGSDVHPFARTPWATSALRVHLCTPCVCVLFLGRHGMRPLWTCLCLLVRACASAAAQSQAEPLKTNGDV